MAHYAPSDFFPTSASAQGSLQRSPSMLRRAFDAVMHARQRQTDQEIASYLAARGGRLTDSLEREIERRFLFVPSGRLF